MKKFEGRRLITCFTSYVGFVYDGCYYYVQIDSNPFMPSLYIKYKIGADMVTENDHYLDEFGLNDWAYDCMFTYEFSEAECKEIANLLLNKLVALPCTGIATEKKRVPNTFDS